MRLRPSPLVEASATFAIAFLLVIATFWAIYRDLNTALNFSTVSALFFMFPVFSAWAFVGFFVKNRVILQRFLFNAGASILITGGLGLFLLWTVSTSDAAESSASSALITSAIIVAIANLVSAVITYRFVLDDNKTKLAKTAYTTINTAPGSRANSSKNSKRKKK